MKYFIHWSMVYDWQIRYGVDVKLSMLVCHGLNEETARLICQRLNA